MQHAAHVDLLQINSHCKLALTYMHACMATCVGPVHAYIFVGNLSQACQVPVDYLASEHVYRLINFDTSGLLKVFSRDMNTCFIEERIRLPGVLIAKN